MSSDLAFGQKNALVASGLLSGKVSNHRPRPGSAFSSESGSKLDLGAHAQSSADINAALDAPPMLFISTCTDPDLSKAIAGVFMPTGTSCERPVYTKVGVPTECKVQIYYWGASSCADESGWWIGPSVGSEMAWARHSDLHAALPPEDGWRTPDGGYIDSRLSVFSPWDGAEIKAEVQVCRFELQEAHKRIARLEGSLGAGLNTVREELADFQSEATERQHQLMQHTQEELSNLRAGLDNIPASPNALMVPSAPNARQQVYGRNCSHNQEMVVEKQHSQVQELLAEMQNKIALEEEGGLPVEHTSSMAMTRQGTLTASRDFRESLTKILHSLQEMRQEANTSAQVYEKRLEQCEQGKSALEESFQCKLLHLEHTFATKLELQALEDFTHGNLRQLDERVNSAVCERENDSQTFAQRLAHIEGTMQQSVEEIVNQLQHGQGNEQSLQDNIAKTSAALCEIEVQMHKRCDEVEHRVQELRVAFAAEWDHFSTRTNGQFEEIRSGTEGVSFGLSELTGRFRLLEQRYKSWPKVPARSTSGSNFSSRRAAGNEREQQALPAPGSYGQGSTKDSRSPYMPIKMQQQSPDDWQKMQQPSPEDDFEQQVSAAMMMFQPETENPEETSGLSVSPALRRIRRPKSSPQTGRQQAARPPATWRQTTTKQQQQQQGSNYALGQGLALLAQH